MKKGHDPLKLYDGLSGAMPFVSSFLDASAVIHLAVLSPDGGMRLVNRTLADCLKASPEELAGQSFLDFLTTPDGETLTRRLASPDASCDEEFLLNVIDTDQIPHSLRFRIAAIEGGFLVLGEPPQLESCCARTSISSPPQMSGRPKTCLPQRRSSLWSFPISGCR